MNFKYLNVMINYIEENLTEDINYIKLARIVGVSEYSLKRIFCFLTDISLSDYIRRRRLSKAFEELKTTNIKIIDLALKYKYDSPVSFSRSFKKMFGLTPKQCRESNEEYKMFSVIDFSNIGNTSYDITYEIKEIEEFNVYAFSTSSKNYEDLLYNIRDLYDKITINGMHAKFNEKEMYGISLCDTNGYLYYVGSKKQYPNMQKFKIPKGKYAIFDVNSRNQEDIVKMENLVYTKWLKSTNYNISGDFNFERYINDKCYLYFKIEDKQN